MSSEYIPRLRRELVAAAAREPVARRPALLRPLVLAAAVAATVLVLVSVLRPEAAPQRPAGAVFTLPGADAAVMRERVAGAGLPGVEVTVDGDAVRVSGPEAMRPALARLTAPGRFGIYDWERSAQDPAAPPDGSAVDLTGSPALTNADVAGVRIGKDPQVGDPVVLIDFTARGAAAFTDLTRAVARAGAKAQADHHLAIVLDGRLLSLPYIDYKQAPDGIDGTAGGQISGGDTRLIAAILASGPLPR